MSPDRLCILGAALLFSTGGTAIKATVLSGWQVAAFRSLLAAAFLWVALAGARRFWSPRTLAVGACYAATLILFVLGNKLTTAVNTIFLQSTAPLYLLVLGPWLLKESIRRTDVAFTLVMGLGLGLFFVGADAPTALATNPSLGNLLGAIAGLTWAFTILGLRWLGGDGTQRDAAAQAVIAGNLAAALVCAPMAFPVSPVGWLDWTLIGYLGLFQIGAAYILMTRGMRGVPALEASLLLLLEPVCSALWAWLFHGEQPGAWSLAGCALILVSTFLRTVGPPALAGHARHLR
ncbi:MAG: EamA family transporter [Acidobacteria bacterium]|nr:EamA family transporter [Acidobacteriota bacterium]